jgi:predicted amidohydrolase
MLTAQSRAGVPIARESPRHRRFRCLYALWRSYVVSRAAETQRFVVGANNAAPDQTCTTLIVAPSGRVIAEAPVGETSTVGAQIELSEVSG